MAGSKWIAIIDDDEEVRAATENLVLSFGHRARTFASAEGFLAADAAAGTACLVTDLQMPGIGGLDLMAELDRRGWDVPTIVVTAFPDERVRRLAEAAGAIAFLGKPFDAALLMEYVRAALASSRSGSA